MTHPLTAPQSALLAQASPSGIAPKTMRVASELRWLEHLGMLSSSVGALYELTEAGRAALGRDALGAGA